MFNLQVSTMSTMSAKWNWFQKLPHSCILNLVVNVCNLYSTLCMFVRPCHAIHTRIGCPPMLMTKQFICVSIGKQSAALADFTPNGGVSAYFKRNWASGQQLRNQKCSSVFLLFVVNMPLLVGVQKATTRNTKHAAYEYRLACDSSTHPPNIVDRSQQQRFVSDGWSPVKSAPTRNAYVQ